MHRPASQPCRLRLSGVVTTTPPPEAAGDPDQPWIEIGSHLYVNLPTAAAALAMIESRLSEGSGFTLATLNLDHAVLLGEPGPFRDAYAAHSHVTADGMPIAWLTRRCDPRAERVAGADLLMPAVEMAARHGAPVALIGATAEVLDRAAEELQSRAPGLAIAVRIAPSYPFDPFGAEAEALIDQLDTSGARLCLIALGAPRQEILAARVAARLPELGILSIGAGIDFIAGTAHRAPAILRRTGLEWSWRLLQEPRRLGPRYWRCVRLLPRLLAEAPRKLHPAAKRPGLPPEKVP